ncbi:MAG: hypothetical protein ACKVU4_01980 [Phycisphaerales bacterium]
MLRLACITLAVAALAWANAGCRSDRPDVASQRPMRLSLSRYRPIELAAFTVHIHPDAERDTLRYRRVRAALLGDLEAIAARIPAPALAVLRESAIVVTPESAPRPGFSGRGMCFHESAAWLTENGFDAAREGAVEVCDMDDYLLWRAEQPMMTFHELAHAFHWRLGFDRRDVTAAHAAARDAGLYRGVAYALAADGETRDAYALVNHKEYFAELSEACFGRNDYFPFTRDDLRVYDPTGLGVVERLWNLSADGIARDRRVAIPTRER